MGYILFGAGEYGERFAHQIGVGKVDLFIDNYSSKYVSDDGIKIKKFEEIKNKILGEKIVVTVSEKYKADIFKQLSDNGLPAAKLPENRFSHSSARATD